MWDGSNSPRAPSAQAYSSLEGGGRARRLKAARSTGLSVPKAVVRIREARHRVSCMSHPFFFLSFLVDRDENSWWAFVAPSLQSCCCLADRRLCFREGEVAYHYYSRLYSAQRPARPRLCDHNSSDQSSLCCRPSPQTHGARLGALYRQQRTSRLAAVKCRRTAVEPLRSRARPCRA